MKAISIPIHKHTPVRRRLSHWQLSEPWWGCNEPLNPQLIVHTGTTKRNRATEIDRMFDDAYQHIALTEVIEVHKRPNILKRIKRRFK